MRIYTHLHVRHIKTGNVLGVDLSGQVHSLSLVSRILYTNIYLLLKETSLDNRIWWIIRHYKRRHIFRSLKFWQNFNKRNIFTMMLGFVFTMTPHNIFNTMSQSCSLHSNSPITNVDLPQLISPAKIIANGCCSFNVKLWKDSWRLHLCLIGNKQVIPIHMEGRKICLLDRASYWQHCTPLFPPLTNTPTFFLLMVCELCTCTVEAYPRTMSRMVVKYIF